MHKSSTYLVISSSKLAAVALLYMLRLRIAADTLYIANILYVLT